MVWCKNVLKTCPKSFRIQSKVPNHKTDFQIMTLFHSRLRNNLSWGHRTIPPLTERRPFTTKPPQYQSPEVLQVNGRSAAGRQTVPRWRGQRSPAQTAVHLPPHRLQVQNISYSLFYWWMYMEIYFYLLDSTSCAVHELRPGDIKVVAALGDSLTVSIFIVLLYLQIDLDIDIDRWHQSVSKV